MIGRVYWNESFFDGEKKIVVERSRIVKVDGNRGLLTSVALKFLKKFG